MQEDEADGIKVRNPSAAGREWERADIAFARGSRALSVNEVASEVATWEGYKTTTVQVCVVRSRGITFAVESKGERTVQPVFISGACRETDLASQLPLRQ